MSHITIFGLGTVGVATATAILARGLSRRMDFVDTNPEKAEGEAWDFSHASCLMPACDIRAVPFAKASGGGLCIISAGVKSRPGESRLDLLERNLVIADQIAGTLERNGLPRILLVLMNPVDVITEAFSRRFASKGVLVLGSGTALDSFRLRRLLAIRAGVSSDSVHAWVVGEHGDSSVSLLSNSTIGCIPLAEFKDAKGRGLEASFLNSLQHEVRSAAVRIIERKGATCHAIGMTAARIVHAILGDENALLPVSVPLAFNISASVPCVIGASGARPLRDVPYSSEEGDAVTKSHEILSRACEKIPWARK